MTVRSDAAPTPDPELESDEHYFREVLDSAMSHTRPPYDLSPAALRRGRRLRTRRRAALGSTAVVATVAVALTAVWLPTDTEPLQRGNDIVATQPPAPEPALPEHPSGYWDMPAPQMADTLAAMLPDGVSIDDPGSMVADTPEAGPASGYLHSTLTGPLGRGDINVMTYHNIGATRSFTVGDGQGTAVLGANSPAAQADTINCPGNLVAPTTCSEIRVDGVHVGRRSTSDLGEVRVLEVVRAIDDGVVYAAVFNAVDRKITATSPVTAPAPLLTMAQLEALVRDEAWTSYEP